MPAIAYFEKSDSDPRTMTIDFESGATVAHYAAHHGNLKFLRWLVHKYPDIPESRLSDFYNCGLVHYATRQGQLPCLMYLVESGSPLDMVDRFGYSALDYALVYKRLYCFIYLYYRCRFTQVNNDLVSNIVDSLLS